LSERVRVKAEAEFDDPDREIIEANGREIGVIRLDGEYYALVNTCLHEGGPVCKGEVRPELVGEFVEPGERIEEDFSGDPTVACPWHGYTYDLASGDHVGDDRYSLPTFDVTTEDGVVYVEV
jgi:nitrite reductase/ring-hydroxylating ferredoxin subunit